MKKIIIAILPWLFTFGHKAFAQEEQIAREKATDGKTKETQEIIIRKKGDKDANITVQINGDQVLINGKPISEFKDDDISVNKKKMIIRNGDHMIYAEGLNDFDESDFNWEAPVNKAFLGVSTEKSDGGARVTAVTKESAAEKAGLQKDDIITKLNDKKIDGPESLFEAITPLKPNDEVKVYIKREGKEKTIKATLQQRTESAHSFSMTSPDGSFKTLTIPNMRRREMDGPMSPEELENMEFNYSYPRQQKIGLKIQDIEEGTGVKVLDVDENSAAATAGLKKNDIITEINGKKITNTDEAREELKPDKDKTTYGLKAYRNGTSMNFNIKIPKKLKTANL